MPLRRLLTGDNAALAAPQPKQSKIQRATAWLWPQTLSPATSSSPQVVVTSGCSPDSVFKHSPLSPFASVLLWLCQPSPQRLGKSRLAAVPWPRLLTRCHTESQEPESQRPLGCCRAFEVADLARAAAARGQEKGGTQHRTEAHALCVFKATGRGSMKAPHESETRGAG